jgi:hypothetical protein
VFLTKQLFETHDSHPIFLLIYVKHPVFHDCSAILFSVVYISEKTKKLKKLHKKSFILCLAKDLFLWYSKQHKCHDRKQVIPLKASRDMPGGARQKADGEMNTFREQRPETV